jgi:hypothetical protein
VSIHYTRNRVPRNPADFPIRIVEGVPISPSGHLCIDVQMPTPLSNPEYGVFLFEATDPTNLHGEVTFFVRTIYSGSFLPYSPPPLALNSVPM